MNYVILESLIIIIINKINIFKKIKENKIL